MEVPSLDPVSSAEKTRLEQAEFRAENAEARTAQAKTRTEAAETRAEQAETRTESAKTRAEHAEIRAEAAETRAEEAASAMDLMIQEKAATSTSELSPGDAVDYQALGLLTSRQREILALIATGENTKQIADTLDISPKTVEYHRKKLMQSLLIHDVPGLVRFALRVGLVGLVPASG